MSHPVDSPSHISNFDLAQLNRKFELANPSRILAWCVENLPVGGLVQASAFNVDDMVITDILYRELRPAKPIPVVFLETLHHFPETLDLVAQAKTLYHLNLKVYKIPKIKTREEFATQYGEALWEQDIEKFHYLTKVEPLQRGLAELGAIAWITGRRRDQAGSRADLPIVEMDSQGRLKINPLANWQRKESWAYVFEHDVIYNPLHDHGYPSIGDQPLTTPIREGEDERAGRWRGSNKTECGMHF